MKQSYFYGWEGIKLLDRVKFVWWFPSHFSRNSAFNIKSTLILHFIMASFIYIYINLLLVYLDLDVWYRILKFFLHGLIFQMSGRLYRGGLTCLVLHCICWIWRNLKIFNLIFFSKRIFGVNLFYSNWQLLLECILFSDAASYLITAECYKEK